MTGGLGDYGSDESEDEDNRSVRGSESSDTDEEELHHRIREKQDAFRRKEREMLLLQEKQAQEAVVAHGKTSDVHSSNVIQGTTAIKMLGLACFFSYLFIPFFFKLH